MRRPMHGERFGDVDVAAGGYGRVALARRQGAACAARSRRLSEGAAITRPPRWLPPQPARRRFARQASLRHALAGAFGGVEGVACRTYHRRQ